MIIYLLAFIYPGENLTEIKNLFSRSVLAKLYKYTYNKKTVHHNNKNYSIRSICKSLNHFLLHAKCFKFTKRHHMI